VIAFLLALLLWTTPVWGQPAPPVGTWAQLSGTAVYPAQPFEAKSASAPGGTPELWSPQGLFAYSGGDVCQLPGGATWGFLLKGGGHGDSPDMSLYWVPLDGSGPQRLTGPYLAPDKAYYYDTPWETYRGTSRNQAPATPSGQVGKARHTYSSLVCAPETGLVFMVGGSITSGSGGGTNATRTYDLTQTTVQAMARPDMGWALKAPAPRSAVASASGWDPVRRRVVTRSSNFIGAYDPATNTWEAWNPPSAPYGSDFQASVAMDVAGRKMYVVGDRLAEMLDLDTKAYTDLRGRPWAAALPGVGSGYLPGPGVSWHARTKQLVVWVGGQSLRLINPLTDEARTLTMTGATVTAASGSGTYGRFRVIPGTDQVVVVNAVDQNVFIGTVPFDGGPVPPPPPPPSSPFVVGALVQTTESLNVRQTPGIPSTILGVQPSGATGTLLEGPVTASGYTWWRIDYATGADGWSAQAYLAVVAPPPVPTLTVDVQLSVGLGLTLTRRSTNTGTPVDLTVDQDTVVRVNGQLVPAPPTPPSPPSGAGVILVPPGQPIPVRQWVERPLPPQGQAYMAGAGGKHGRAFYHPRFSGLVFAGGDWKTSQPTLEAGNGTGSEVWTLNARTDTWTRLRPFCVPGEPQPGSPDTVGWAYDSVRDRGIMTPGFYFITQGATDPCGSVYGWGAYAFSFVPRQMFTHAVKDYDNIIYDISKKRKKSDYEKRIYFSTGEARIDGEKAYGNDYVYYEHRDDSDTVSPTRYRL